MDAEDPLYPDTTAFSQTCGGCGRSFAQLNAFTNHSSSCGRKKRLFSSTLASAQEAYRKQKQRRLEERQKLPFAPDVQDKQPQDLNTPPVSIPAILTNLMILALLPNAEFATIFVYLCAFAMSNLKRKLRFHLQKCTTMKIRKLLTSPRNVFGLFQQYGAEGFPTHDPEVEQQHTALSEVASDHKEILVGSAIFGPYPNKSAFLLGEWYWNDGMQKTKAGFKRRDFRPEDIQGVPWDALNEQLGGSEAAGDVEDTCAPPIPAEIHRNPPESAGIRRNGTGIRRNPQEWDRNPQESTGMELESGEFTLIYTSYLVILIILDFFIQTQVILLTFFWFLHLLPFC
ncbi:uncharacterized protein LACBIDRAFT_333851 [Laccaria bicolor S238N-H82]|uniref:Predicted protein n=1 Tax=Laccaria bicolor (strain S238N-H82 / ATCC MYA-4686) TaxID=486041 RepID=B0DXA2_LACBS|nr:uncharacterized protein LACBIDRAFT_333851 [Laccaria bicolor S238N-H82]EDR00759.1 predicted protein [Laccaria bicolor S238N-H82]|eukprot:XP_001888551.1 predicted protein [Laccaria bicolor S238N-H82]